MPYEFYMGMEARQVDDEVEYAAALIEKSHDTSESDEEAEYRIHALKTYRGEQIEQIAEDVLGLAAGEPFTGRTVFVTNVGNDAVRHLHGALRDRGASPFSISVTEGDTSPQQGRPLSFAPDADEAVHVSERELVSAVQRIYRAGRLDLEAVKDEVTSVLVRSLEAYQIASDVADQEGGKRSVEEAPDAAVESHLVLASAAACWLAEQHRFDPTVHLAGDPPPVREAKRNMRPDTA